ncbi:MAG: MFS transporter, partial [Anaerolineae bacterium]|nr:MFS transporter [Anaerolineae bacterium]NIN94963.1 MFS transporter [Anaerolineae bacterium]NIQ78007.1 MFS transporter [Anaerolineae bacterium]
FIAGLIGFAAFMMVEPFFAVYAEENLGISKSEWGVLNIFFSLVILVFAIPCGKLID